MTTPYTTGTVSLTNGSAVITGIGTAWAAALIAGGTVYVEADGNPLPILSVNSETQITAAIKWKGATGTYPYAIMRDTAYGQQTVANANALATYIQRLNNEALAALAVLDPAADKLPYFTGDGTAGLATLTAFARTLLGGTDAAAMRSTLSVVGRTATSSGDLNAAERDSFKMFDGVSLVNGPTASPNFTVITAGDAGRGMQIANEYGNPTGAWFRPGIDGWKPWRFLWNTAGTGLSNTTNGYQSLPSGLKLQWGVDDGTGGADKTITFPLSFAQGVFAVVVTPLIGVGPEQLISSMVNTVTLSNFLLWRRIVFNGGVVQPAVNCPVFWFAVGQ